MSFQRVVQGLSLGLFIAALICAPKSFLWVWPADGFLRMDPIVLLGTIVVGREFAPLLWIAGFILLVCIFVGRFFCAYLCPLGATIDVSDHFLRARRKRSSQNKHGNAKPSRLKLRRLKYQVLFFILGAGILGVSFVFIASPMSLATRLYGLLIYPALSYLADLGLVVLRPVADHLNFTAITYAVVKVPRYGMQWLTFAILFSLFAGGVWAPRFWCRNICPSGALFALFSWKPVIRRHVSPHCSQCGLCARQCPMGAIGEATKTDDLKDPLRTNHSECIACLSCAKVCPTQAVSFSAKHQLETEGSEGATLKISLDRRRVLGAGLSGTAAAILTLTGLKSPHSTAGPGNVVHPAVIRPPGAIPENRFLARCIRCGQCMHTCPTNTLQPLGLEAGLSAIFSPVITPRRGPCAPGCNACGQVCPTGSLKPLHLEEKMKAKVGTARLFRQKCLAWELDKKCLICDEVCPFDAIEFRKPADKRIAVPFINENKCFGCGYCQFYCPVQAIPAIVVEPMLALRLSEGSYRSAAKEMGYSLEIKKADAHAIYFDQEDSFAPQLDGKGLPPGFTE